MPKLTVAPEVVSQAAQAKPKDTPPAPLSPVEELRTTLIGNRSMLPVGFRLVVPEPLLCAIAPLVTMAISANNHDWRVLIPAATVFGIIGAIAVKRAQLLEQSGIPRAYGEEKNEHREEVLTAIRIAQAAKRAAGVNMQLEQPGDDTETFIRTQQAMIEGTWLNPVPSTFKMIYLGPTEYRSRTTPHKRKIADAVMGMFWAKRERPGADRQRKAWRMARRAFNAFHTNFTVYSLTATFLRRRLLEGLLSPAEVTAVFPLANRLQKKPLLRARTHLGILAGLSTRTNDILVKLTAGVTPAVNDNVAFMRGLTSTEEAGADRDLTGGTRAEAERIASTCFPLSPADAYPVARAQLQNQPQAGELDPVFARAFAELARSCTTACIQACSQPTKALAEGTEELKASALELLTLSIASALEVSTKWQGVSSLLFERGTMESLLRLYGDSLRKYIFIFRREQKSVADRVIPAFAMAYSLLLCREPSLRIQNTPVYQHILAGLGGSIVRAFPTTAEFRQVPGDTRDKTKLPNRGELDVIGLVEKAIAALCQRTITIAAGKLLQAA